MLAVRDWEATYPIVSELRFDNPTGDAEKPMLSVYPELNTYEQ